MNILSELRYSCCDLLSTSRKAQSQPFNSVAVAGALPRAPLGTSNRWSSRLAPPGPVPGVTQCAAGTIPFLNNEKASERGLLLGNPLGPTSAPQSRHGHLLQFLLQSTEYEHGGLLRSSTAPAAAGRAPCGTGAGGTAVTCRHPPGGVSTRSMVWWKRSRNCWIAPGSWLRTQTQWARCKSQSSAAAWLLSRA